MQMKMAECSAPLRDECQRGGNTCSFKQTSNWRTQKQLSDTHTLYIVRRRVGGVNGVDGVDGWRWEVPPAGWASATKMTNVLLIDLLTTSSWHLAAVSSNPETG